MINNELKQQLHLLIEKYKAQAISLSDDMAMNPETGYEEFRASQNVVNVLKSAGYQVEYPYLDYSTGFHAVFNNGDGPSIALLTEYDALPVLGHACGHNVSGAMSVLAALALKELKDNFKGSIHVFGTPAEETDGAKVGMAKEGAFDGMDLAIMIHCEAYGHSRPNMPGLGLRGYNVEFFGKTAHPVASPWTARSALAAARKFLDLIDARRECFTHETYANSIITSGGEAPNILPGYASVQIDFRSNTRANLDLLTDMIEKCAKGAALALDCEVQWSPSLQEFDGMLRIPSLERAVKEAYEDLGIHVSAILPPFNSSDVGNVSYRCPTIQPSLAITDQPYEYHTPEFADATMHADGHKALQLGGETIATISLAVLNNETFRKEVRDEFKKHRS